MSKSFAALLFLILSFQCMAGIYGEPEFEFSSFYAPRELNLEDIQRLSDSHWTPLVENKIHQSSLFSNEYVSAASESTLWIQIRLPRRSDENEVFIELSPNVGLNGLIAQYINGRWRWSQPEGVGRSASEHAPANYLTFKLQSTSESRVAYLKLNTSISYHFQIQTYTPSGFLHYSVANHIFHGFIFGFLCLAIIYNLIIGVSANEKIYIFYSFYALSNLLYISVMSGYLRLAFPEWGGSGNMSNLGASLVLFSALVFVREFLSTEEYIPNFDRLLRAMQAITFVTLLVVTFINELLALLSTVTLGLICPAAIVIAAIRCHRLGHPYAKYFLLAWGVFIITVMAWVMMWVGIVMPYPIVEDMFKIGTLLEITLLSIVLAYRYSYLKDQTEALNTARLTYEKLSETDDLTGIYNRRGFLKHANKMISDTDTGYVWLAMDVDHFKQFNDRHGHHPGDKLLSEFGRMLSTNQRRDELAARLSNADEYRSQHPKAIAGRLGGEEFAVLLNMNSVAQARLYAERLLEDFRNLLVDNLNGKQVGTTISIGVTQVREEDTLEEAWRRADKLLYQAKSNGRDQVVSDNNDAYETSSPSMI